MKKFIAMLLALAMVAGWITIPPVHAHAEEVPHNDGEQTVTESVTESVDSTEPSQPEMDPVLEPVTYPETAYDYATENGEVVITGLRENIEGYVALPATLGGYPVTRIAAKAFQYLDGLTGVVIPDSVTEIGTWAFGSCPNLTTVILGSGLNVIGNYAFNGCSMLKTFCVKEENTRFSSDASGVLFDRNKTVLIMAPYAISGSYVVPDSVHSIIGNAFDSCTELTDVTLPDSLTDLGSYAFAGCTSLKEIVIPGSVYQIPSSAFVNCTALTDVTIGYGVMSIGARTFRGCEKLEKVSLPDGLMYIRDAAFAQCKKLVSITIPNSVIDLGDEVFSECVMLNEAKIGEGITAIGQNCFKDCSALIEVTIPVSVTSVEYNAFKNCNALTTVFYAGTQEQWDAINIIFDNEALLNANIIFLGEGTTEPTTAPTETPIYPTTAPTTTPTEAPTEAPTIEPSVEATEATGATEPSRPEVDWESVLSFELNEDGKSYSVSGCRTTATGALTIPATYDGLPVTVIGDEAFWDCTRLTTVTIPDSVTTIGEYAFCYCDSLTSVTIPDSVTTIGYSAFFLCASLNGIWVSENNPNYSSDSNGVLFDKDKTTLIAAPGTIANCIIPGSVATIDEYAFWDCTRLTAVTIPDSVTSIGEGAFCDCHSLTDVYYTGTQEQWNAITIGEDNEPLWNADITFLGEDPSTPTTAPTAPIAPTTAPTEPSQPELDWEKYLTFMPLGEEWYVISNCDESIVGDLEIPATWNGRPVVGIAECAFDHCQGLTSVVIPKSVSSIGAEAFRDCASLQKITMLGVEDICEQAFYACVNLTCVSLGDALKCVREYAFSGCDKLTDVYFDDTAEQWSNVVFEGYNEPLLDANITFLGEGPTEPTEPSAPESGWKNGLYFTLNEDGMSYTVSDCDEKAVGDLIVPATYSGLPVTVIGYAAFSNCNELTNVAIPESVTDIGSYAFYGCYNLLSVNIPAGVSVIHSHTFLYCEDLTEIVIPDDVTRIDTTAFDHCTSLLRVTIPESVTFIGSAAFWGCQDLVDVFYGGSPAQWATIEIQAGNDALLNANIHFADEEPVEPTEPSVGPTEPPVDPTDAPIDPTCAPVEPTEPSQPEADWENYLTFELNEDGQSYRVNDCLDNVVGKVVVPETYNGLPVTMIGEYAFSCCYGLTEVELPQTITVINYNAFSNCSSLQSVNLPDGLVAIAEWAFASCDLREIQIPANVEYIGVGAFNGCPLTGIWLDENNTYYANDDKGVLFSKDMTLLMASPYGLTGSYAIPDGVEYIGNNAFSNTRLSEVTFPDSVEEIGSGAFNNCYLTEIVIGSGVKYIATDAFVNCEYLGAVTVPNSVISIDDYAFQYSPNVTFYCHIGAYAATYADDFDIPICYLDAVKEVSIATMPQKLVYPLDGHLKLAGLSLNVTLEDDTVVTLYNGYAVGAYDFSTAGTKTVTVSVSDKSVSFEVTVDDQLIEYPESNHPYQSNSDITWKFTYPGDVDMLAITFSQDTMVEHNFDYIYIADSEGNETRYTGRELAGKKIYIQGKIFTVRLTSDSSSTDYGFAITSIEVLKKVDIDKVTFTPNPDGTGYIVTDCDESVEGLLEIPAEYEGLPVVGIGENAFQNCSELQEITIPISISAIGNAAFSGCNKLTDVYYGSSRKRWNTIQMGEGNEILSAVTLHFAYCEGEHTPGDSAVVDEWGGNSCLDTKYQSVATYCLDCGIEIERERVILPPKGHTPGEPVIENEWTGGCTECGGYQEVIYCTECNDTLSRVNVVAEPTGHIVGETILNEQPATCNTKGYREWQTFCATCGYVIKSITEEIPATGHTPGRTEAERTDPTCDTNGYIWTMQYCADCNMQIGGTYEVLPATDHIPGEVQKEIVNEGSCTNDRVYWNKVYCQNCWRTLSADYVVEKATGHTPGEPVKENEWFAGCENAGHYDEVVYCTNEYCGMQLSWKQVTVPPLGHTEEIIPGYAPTCTESGMTDGKYCTTCGQTIWWPEEIERLGHTPAEPVFEDAEGDYYYSVTYCSVCNAELHRVLVAICKHENQTTVFLGDPATCTEPGVAIWEVHCVDCGEILSSDADEIPATGHINTTETVTTVDATCTTAGSKTTTVTCACGEVVSTNTETIEAKGHTKEIIPGKEATCTATGLTEGVKCTVCGEILTAQVVIPMYEHTVHTQVVENAISGTCTENGYFEWVCYCVCGAELSREENITYAPGHTEEVVAGKAATCTETGLTEGKKCSVCGETITAQTETAALGHSYTNYVADGKGNLVAECDNGCGTTDSKVDPGFMDMPMFATIDKNGKLSVATKEGALFQSVIVYYIGNNEWTYPTGDINWANSYHKAMLNITLSNDAFEKVNSANGYRQYTAAKLAEAPKVFRYGNYVIRMRGKVDGVAKNIVQVINVQELEYSFGLKYAKDGKIIVGGDTDYIDRMNIYYIGDTAWNYGTGEGAWYSSYHKYLTGITKSSEELLAVNGAAGYRGYGIYNLPRLQALGNYVINLQYTAPDGTQKNIVYVKNIDDTIEAPLTYNVKIANNGKVVLTGNAPRVENVTVYYFGETEYTMEKGEVVYFSDSLKKYLLLTSKANPEGFGAMGYQKFIPDNQPVYTVKGNYVFRVLYTDYDGVLKSYMLTATY